MTQSMYSKLFMNRTIKYYIFTFIIGTVSMFTQVAFMRLASTVFHGNELTYCIITGHWLLWTSFGSRLGGFLVKKINVDQILPPVSILYVIMVVLFSYLIYLIRPILNISNSEILGLGKIFLIIGIILLPPTLLNGMFFPLIVNFVKKRIPDAPVSGIYASEVFGSAFGSLVFALLIYLDLSTFSNLHLVSAILVMTIIIILQKNIKYKILTFLIIPLFAISLLFIKSEIIEIRWQPMQVIKQYETPHQEIVETTYRGDKVIYGNGEVMPIHGNIEFAEELIHFPLLSHSSPESVLIIGLIDSTIVSQVEKYNSVQNLTVINDNRQLQTRLAGKIESEDIAINYRFIDPVTSINILEKKYDVAILNVSQPLNILWNRFYTSQFFSGIKAVLAENGVFDITLPGGENYLARDHIKFLKISANTASQSFPDIQWIPGQTIHILAGNSETPINYKSFVNRLNEKEIQNKYITDYYLVDRLSRMKIEFLHEKLKSIDEAAVNTLMAPIAFYFNTILWNQKSGGFLTRVYKNLAELSGYLVVTIIFILILSALLTRRDSNKFLIVEMTLVGFFHLVFENLLIIIFQSFIGALYLKIIFLFFAFMTGAGMGSLYFHKSDEIQYSRIPFWIMFLLPPALYIIIQLNIFMSFLLPLVLFISGLVDGYLFPYILKRFKNRDESSLAGQLYAADILGSCLGAYLFSAIILPIWGINVSIFFVGLVGLAMLVGEFVRS